MARQKRLIQAAVRVMQFTKKGSVAASHLETMKNTTNRSILQRYGIPNVVQLGHTLAAQLSDGGKDRPCGGISIAWPGLHVVPQALASRGGIIEICSSGQQCREVVAQLALAEARSGSVLWMAVGPQAEAAVSCGLEEVPNLTYQRWPIANAADSVAALQHLRLLVRSQRHTVVVLDCVAGLAPPLQAAAGRPPALLGAAPAARPAAAAGPAAAAEAAAAGPAAAAEAAAAGPAAAAEAAAAGPAAAAEAAAAGPAAAAEAAAADLVGKHSEAAVAGVVGSHPAAVTPDAGPLRAGGGPALKAAAAGVPAAGGGSAGVNLKFLMNVLPQLLEDTLTELAASCGPELRTTTLLLNTYNRQEQGCHANWGPSAANGSGGRSRWARRAIARHASATLHLLPDGTGSAGPGGHGHCGALRAVLTKGLPSGDDGGPLFMGSLSLPGLSPAQPHVGG